jgi:hypothetical protein
MMTGAVQVRAGGGAAIAVFRPPAVPIKPSTADKTAKDIRKTTKNKLTRLKYSGLGLGLDAPNWFWFWFGCLFRSRLGGKGGFRNGDDADILGNLVVRAKERKEKKRKAGLLYTYNKALSFSFFFFSISECVNAIVCYRKNCFSAILRYCDELETCQNG